MTLRNSKLNRNMEAVNRTGTVCADWAAATGSIRSSSHLSHLWHLSLRKMDTLAWERVNCAQFSVDAECDTNRKRSAERADSHITPHPLLSPWPAGEDVMASFLNWHTIRNHWGCQSVCWSYWQDRSCLKYFLISLAPWLRQPHQT